MPVAPVNGQQIAYDDTGGSGPPVVLGHGFLMDRTMFRHQVDALKDRYRVITWDERAHGETKTTNEPFTYWDLADDLAGLLDHLGIEHAVVGGMSQGGFIALRFALRYPDRAQALVLMSTQAGTEDPDKAGQYDMLANAWEQGPDEQVFLAVGSILFGPGWEGADEWTAKWRALGPGWIRPPYTCLMNRDDVTDRLAGITAPALVIHGDADLAIGHELAEALCHGLPNCAGLVTVEGGGHSANLTHPHAAEEPLRAFLAEHAA